VQSPKGTLAPGATLTDGSQDVLVPDKNQLDALLPLLLVTGMGGTGGLSLGGDGSSSGSDGSLMLLALMLAFANKK
jgi:hypothetical protein